jgi:hypothetical protein
MQHGLSKTHTHMQVMSELERNATLAGYNDSLHPGAGGETGGEEEGDEGVTPQLTVEAAKQAPPPKVRG